MLNAEFILSFHFIFFLPSNIIDSFNIFENKQKSFYFPGFVLQRLIYKSNHNQPIPHCKGSLTSCRDRVDPRRFSDGTVCLATDGWTRLQEDGGAQDTARIRKFSLFAAVL